MKYIFVAATVVICGFVFSFILFFFRPTSKISAHTKGVIIYRFPTLTLTPTPVIFKNQQITFDEGAFEQYTLPEEIKNITDSMTTKLNCTDVYKRNSDEELFYPYGDPSKKLIDIRIRDALSPIMEFIPNRNALTVILCFSQQNGIYAMLENDDSSQEFSHSIYFGNISKSFQLITTLQNKASANTHCFQPLFLTKNNFFYWKCSDMKEGIVSATIYRIDITNKAYKIVMKCIDTIEYNDTHLARCN